MDKEKKNIKYENPKIISHLCRLLILFFAVIASVFGFKSSVIKASPSTRATNVAKAVSSGGTYYFDNLQDACNNVVWFGGGTVYVLANITTDTVTVGYNPVTIMPKGGNWTITHYDYNGSKEYDGTRDYSIIAVEDEHPTTLTFAGNGNYSLTLNGNGVENAVGGNKGTVTVKNGVTIKNNRGLIWTTNVINISGGTFNGGDSNDCYGVHGEPGTINISGGTFINANGAVCGGSNTTINISGGNFYSNKYAVNSSGIVYFKGGNIYENTEGGILNNWSTVYVSGGSIYKNSGSGIVNIGNLYLTGGNIYSNSPYGISYGNIYMSGNAFVNTNNPVYVGKDAPITVNGALSKTTVASIAPESYTLLTNLVKTTYSGGSGSAILSKFSVSSSDGTYCVIPSGQYLVLSRKYTVNYYGNGATSGSTAKNTATYNQSFLTTKNGFKRTGYTFNGWSPAADGSVGGWGLTSSGVYESGKSWTWTRTEKLNLYAQWTHNKYTVTYDANGGSTANTTKNYYYADKVDLSLVAEKNGKIFVGWNTDPNATKAMESFVMPDCATSSNSDYKNDWEVTLYAIYTIPVSDVANHTYPDYEQVKEEEVYFRVWEVGNESNIRVYPLTYNIDTNMMRYRYVLPTTDISDFVSGMTSYGYEILAFDNAGNYRSLYKNSATPPPLPVKYEQTVIHFIYDHHLQTWVEFHQTTEKVLEGMTYTPAYTTPPAGYKNSHIDEEYIVRGEQTSGAYYVPIDYKLTFDANGGTCDVTEKIITYNDYYGVLPTPTREGYEFIGWYTEKDGDSQILSSHKYLTPADTTVYAHWKVLEFPVTYDYWTNGGSSAEESSGNTEYAQAIDLSPKAYKEGWEFVGWNTDSTATTGLDSMNMPARPVTLYAIYKKDITLTIIEQNDSGQITRSQTKTIYNTEKEASFSMTEENRWSGWNFLGWTDGTLATDYPIVSIGNVYRISESSTLYGLYTTTVTLSYDTNGSSMIIEDQTKDCYYNASGDALYPEYVIAEAPELSLHSFVSWMDKDGDEYMPGEKHSFDKDTILTSKWDRHPEIEAYDRYFTLEQAQSGEITEGELLKKVVGTDLEDGTLVNGVDVIVKDYCAQDFASLDTDKEIEITYQATDSFGNIVTKIITVNVTDTTVRKSTTKRYVRFISSQFFQDSNGDFISTDKGGLEETSLWRTDTYRLSLLEELFRGNDVDAEVWIFSQKELKEIKEKS